MSKHTPGPWYWNDPKGINWLMTADKTVLSASHDNQFASRVSVSQGDAHLISAAPDLLKAAKWSVGFCVTEILKLKERQLSTPDIGENDPKYLQIFIDQYERIRKECQDAIDKAEGGGALDFGSSDDDFPDGVAP